MRIINKEQERQELQADPEFRRKEKLKKLLYGAGIFIFCIVAYFYYHSPSTTGTPHITQIDSMMIEPGKTTVQELADYGFDISDNTMFSGQVYDILSPVDGKSYYDFLTLLKDGRIYATIAVVNENSGKKTLADCKVREIRVRDFNMDYENTMVDGVKMPELTVEFLTEHNGEPYDSYTVNDEEYGTLVRTIWEKGRYSIELEMSGDGIVTEFVSKYEWK